MNTTQYYTSTADIKVTSHSIVFSSLNGDLSYDATDAKYNQILTTVIHQLKCGPTTADFLAAQHIFVEEGEMLAWLDLFGRKGEGVFAVEGKDGLFETYSPVEISSAEIAECLAEDMWFDR